MFLSQTVQFAVGLFLEHQSDDSYLMEIIRLRKKFVVVDGEGRQAGLGGEMKGDEARMLPYHV